MDERAKADCVANARAMAPVIIAAVPRIEAGRELPPDLVAALHEARLFRMLVPRSLGGEEISPVEYLEAVEELAKADASTAWCIAQTSVCSTIASCLKPQTAAAIFKQDPRGVLAWGPFGRNARAVAEKAGFRVTGTWPFASGSRHATWLAAHCPVYEPDGQPRRDANGNPLDMTFVLPRDCATISDVWHVIGLKGTGSDSYAVTGLLVPEDRAIGLFARNPAERREHGPLYSFTIFQLFGSSFAAIALGIARSALDAFVELARAKTPTGGKSVLRDNAVIQSQVGVAEVPARRRARVPVRRIAGHVAGRLPVGDDVGRAAGAVAHGVRSCDTSGKAGRRHRLSRRRRHRDLRKQSVRAPVPRRAHGVATGAVAFLGVRGDRPAFPRPAAASAAVLTAPS